MVKNFLSNIDIFNYSFAAEAFLGIASMLLLAFFVRKGDESTEKNSWCAIICLFFTIFIVVQIGADYINPIENFYKVSSFLTAVKLVLLLGSAVSIFLYIGHLEYNIKNKKFEYPLLIIFSLIGMFIMISAQDFLSLYLGLELQSLAIYIMVSINVESKKSNEAGLKYFVLGSLASCILLYGISLIYGFTGSIFFNDISSFLGNSESNIGILIGMVFILVAMFFKISTVPFHMWTPDVYEGSPTPVMLFISTIPKVSSFVILFRILTEPFLHLQADWGQIVVCGAVLSLLVGAFGAVGQRNFKRLLAYSSINHVGFILLAIFTFEFGGDKSFFSYLIIYVVMSFAAVTFLMLIKQRHHSANISNKEPLEDINSFAGISKTMPLLCIGMTIVMLSMAGVPPLAGFFAKFLVLKSILAAGYYKLAILAALSAVVTAYYYLKIIKIMFFDEATEVFSKRATFIIESMFTIFVLINLCFFLIASDFVQLIDFIVK